MRRSIRISAKKLFHVMLNWFQHLKSMNYETLNQVQGDKYSLEQGY
jgi:hypothetical protein